MAKPEDLTSKYIAKRAFFIGDVANDARIAGRTFENCDIYGPAVLYISGVGQMHRCTIDDPSYSIIELSPTQKGMVGPIHVVDSSFRECTFHRIGFLTHKQDIPKLVGSLDDVAKRQEAGRMKSPRADNALTFSKQIARVAARTMRTFARLLGVRENTVYKTVYKRGSLGG